MKQFQNPSVPTATPLVQAHYGKYSSASSYLYLNFSIFNSNHEENHSHSVTRAHNFATGNYPNSFMPGSSYDNQRPYSTEEKNQSS